MVDGEKDSALKRAPVTEDDVKDLVKEWYGARAAWHYAPIQNGMGVHGIHDRVGCVPIVVTPQMVGKRIGLFVSVESKRPGRRGEKDRGMSAHQRDHMNDINAAGGVAICCDGAEDLADLDRRLSDLTGLDNCLTHE